MIIGKGIIKIEIDGLSPQELDRCKSIIDTLLIEKVFFIRNGSVELHFDNDGSMNDIVFHTRWKRNKPKPIVENFKNVKIDVIQT